MSTGVVAPPGGSRPPVPAPAGPGRTPPPPTGVLLLRVLGLAGLVLLVGLGAVGVVSGFLENRDEQTRSFAGVRTVDVSTTFGDVVVRSGPAGSAASVTTTRRWSFATPTVRSAVEDGALRLRATCPAVSPVARCSVDVAVTVPADAAVQVSTTAGDVRLDGTTGAVTVATTSGDVLAAGVRSGRVDARTTAGDVRLEFAGAPDDVTARTTAGDVVVLVPDDGTKYRLRTSTGAGTRTTDALPQDDASAHRIDVATTVGDITARAGAA